MDDVLINDHNYVRPDTLSLVSVESLAIVTVILYFVWLVLHKRATLENAFFLALPFSDSIFRLFMVQPSEVIGLLMVLLNLRNLRLTPVLFVAATFLGFSIWGSVSTDLPSWYSFLYSCRFLLTAAIFSALVYRPTTLSADVVRFSVATTFLWTFLQIGLWLAGLPIDGVFFNGFIPRPKGLAHEPATWAIWIVSLVPYVSRYRLGYRSMVLALASLLATFSTFGFVSAGAFFMIRALVAPRSTRQRQLLWLIGACVAGVILVGLVCAFVELPEAAMTLIDKLTLYLNEMLQFTGLASLQVNSQLDASGRDGDFILFEELFFDNWLLGIGSFNSIQADVSVEFIPATNTYIMFLVELGVLGCGILCVLFGCHYWGLWRSKVNDSGDCLALSFAFLVMIAGIRCFAFHELWYAQANVSRRIHRRQLLPGSLRRRSASPPWLTLPSSGNLPSPEGHVARKPSPHVRRSAPCELV